jgi:hypothetical protein
LGSDNVQAWAQVASSTQGHNPPIHTIKLISKVGLMDMSDEQLIEVLRNCRNH